jgi:hypothetical protein
LGVEGEEIVFADTVIIAKEFQSGLYGQLEDEGEDLEDAGFGVLVRNSKHDYCATVLMIEIDAF